MSEQNGNYIEAQRDLNEEQQAREAGISQAATAGYDQAEINQNKEFFEEYSDPDVSAGPQASKFEERVAPELSHHHLFGNITREEYERRQLDNEVLAMRMKAEFPQAAGASSKCTGSYRKAITGEDKPTLDAEKARHIDSTLGEMGVRSQMQSQSIEASAWRGITTMKSVVETVRDGTKKASRGALGRAKRFIFGSDNS